MKTHLTRRDTLKLLAAGAAGLMVPGMPAFGTTRESVEYRRLGRTNLQVSVVGFHGSTGCAPICDLFDSDWRPGPGVCRCRPGFESGAAMD